MRAYVQIILVVWLTYTPVSFGKGRVAITASELQAAITALVAAQPSITLSAALLHDIRQIIGDTTRDTEPEALLQEGNLQEVIWHLQDVGFADRALQLEKLLAALLQYEEIVTIDTHGRNRNYNLLHVVTFASGLRGVFKNGHSASNEGAVYRFDKLIGLHVFPLTVSRLLTSNFGNTILYIGEPGALQLYMPAAAASEIAELLAAKHDLDTDISYAQIVHMVDHLRNQHDLDTDVSDTKTVQRLYHLLNKYYFNSTEHKPFVPAVHPKIRTLQFLTRDTDASYPGNYMFPTRGRSFAIDGGYAFKAGTTENKYVKDFIKHPHNYFSDADFIARLEKNYPRTDRRGFAPRVPRTVHQNR